MYRSVALLLNLVTLSFIPSIGPAAAPVGGGAPPSRVASVAVTSGGVRLSLGLPRTAYPHNALVLATVRLTNLTGRPINTWDCLRSSLGAEVSSPGTVGVAYPPLLSPPGAPWSDCPGEMGMGGMAQRQMTAIPVGQTLTRMTYVVLRDFTVRGWAQLMVKPAQMKPTLIQTPQMFIRDRRLPGPSVQVRMGSPISARVTPVPGAGPILYSEYASCYGKTPNDPFAVSATLSQWSRAPGTVLYPFHSGCPSLAEWMIFVAQPGRPIARAYYCARHDRCAYAPPTPQERGVAACKEDVTGALVSGLLPRSAARYAVGLDSILPPGLTPAQQALAEKFHARCAPLLAPHGHIP